MRNLSKLHRAAMGALVAGALIAGAGQAGAAVYRFPADTPSQLLPLGKAKRAVSDASAGVAAKLRLMMASVWRFPEGGGLRISRFPARIVPRND
jgi:hypothetical protein